MSKSSEPGERELISPVLYGELHQLASRLMRGQGSDHTLQPTALVHEAWLKLSAGSTGDWRDRDHFLAVAAHTMRNVLVDHARAKAAIKRGGDRVRVPLANDEADEDCTTVLELNDALEALARIDPQLARLVELRGFGGLGVDETARVLGMSPRSVKRAWRVARAWLHCHLSEGDAGPR